MLRRVENVQVFYKRDLWALMTGKYKILLEVGRKQHLSAGRLSDAAFRAMEAQSASTPVRYMKVGDRTFWRHADRWHSDNEDFTQETVHALLTMRAMRQNDRVNRAMTVAAMGQAPVPSQRGAIPPDVKQVVWQRDGGACRACGSNVERQFDHVIPVSVGGGSTEDNLQTLCGPRNRRKGDSIA